MGMRRWGRAVAALVVSAVVSTTLAGCIGPLATQDVEVAAPAVDPGCLVGSWKQTEGWNRLRFDDGTQTVLRMISGGATFSVDASGTAKISYAADTVWQGEDGSTRQTVKVAYSGTGTVTFSAVNGDFRQVSDFTRRTQTVTVGTASQTTPGTAGVIFEGTYRCDRTDLVISNKDTRAVYTRA
jgi:hypothetical protein